MEKLLSPEGFHQADLMVFIILHRRTVLPHIQSIITYLMRLVRIEWIKKSKYWLNSEVFRGNSNRCRENRFDLLRLRRYAMEERTNCFSGR
ncbi:MAG TPA: hypothetical protein DCS74_03300 [Veillonellaceae bacterium]|nr:hypothetical protein [Veillonellaceae bacterium]